MIIVSGTDLVSLLHEKLYTFLSDALIPWPDDYCAMQVSEASIYIVFLTSSLAQ